jgi:hypothetical protein
MRNLHVFIRVYVEKLQSRYSLVTAEKGSVKNDSS